MFDLDQFVKDSKGESIAVVKEVLRGPESVKQAFDAVAPGKRGSGKAISQIWPCRNHRN